MWVCQKFMWVQSIFSVGPIKNLCRFSQFFIPILSYYFILPLCRQIKVLCFAGITPYIRTHPSLRSGAVRATCYAVARIGLEKKERGSCNSHPSFYYSEFKLYSLSRKFNIEVPNVRPTFNWKRLLTYTNFHL